MLPSSPPRSRKRPLASKKTPSANGPNKDSSPVSAPPETIADTTSVSSSGLEETPKPKKPSSRKKNQSVTVESLPTAKKKTSKGKSRTCKSASLDTGSSETLVPASTSNAEVSEPFWSLPAKAMSQKLWLPTETDFAGLPLNSSSGSFHSMESNSWFSMKTWKAANQESLPKTCSLSSTFSIAVSKDDENIKDEKTRKGKAKTSTKKVANSGRRIRLRPNAEVSKVLKQWFGCVRKTYNWALGCMKDKPSEYKLNMYWLRKRFVNKCNIPKKYSYLLDTPKHVRDSALEDLVGGFKANMEKKKTNPDHQFEMHYRSKKDCQSITIPSTAIKLLINENSPLDPEIKMFPTFLKNVIKFHVRKRDGTVPLVQYDCKLTIDQLGRFYLCIPQHVPVCDNQADTKRHDWVALDPGVRTFMTGYSPTPGVCFQLAPKDINKIYRLCKHLDVMSSKSSKSNNKCKRSRYKMKKVLVRLRNRIQHLVDEVHWKCINFLVKNFRNIIIPPFNTSQMVKRGHRRIGSKVARQMLCWRHYTFRRRLIDKVKLLQDTRVHVRGEEYTTKSCTNCLQLHHKIGGNKRFNCPHCLICVDRDVTGSRNIFMKNISAIEQSMALPR